MFIEEKIDRILALLEAASGQQPVAETATKRTRKPKPGAASPGTSPEVTDAPAPAAVAAEADPFAEGAPEGPKATQAEMRDAVLKLRDATDQATALSVLKKFGAASFQAVKEADFGAIVVAAKALMPAPKDAAPAEDPFADVAPAAEAKTITLDDVKAAVVKAQKRAKEADVIKVVMDLGGVGVNQATGAKGASMKALPPANYAKVLEQLAALPSVKG